MKKHKNNALSYQKRKFREGVYLGVISHAPFCAIFALLLPVASLLRVVGMAAAVPFNSHPVAFQTTPVAITPRRIPLQHRQGRKIVLCQSSVRVPPTSSAPAAYRLSLVPYIDLLARRRRRVKSHERQQRKLKKPQQLWNVSWLPPEPTATLYTAGRSVQTTPSTIDKIDLTVEYAATRGSFNAMRSIESKNEFAKDSNAGQKFSKPHNRTQNEEGNSTSVFVDGKQINGLKQNASLTNEDAQDPLGNITSNNRNNSEIGSMKNGKEMKRKRSDVTSPIPFIWQKLPTFTINLTSPSKNKATTMTFNSTANLSDTEKRNKTDVVVTPYSYKNSFLESVSASLQSTTNEILRSTTANMAAMPSTPYSNRNRSSAAMIRSTPTQGAANPLQHLKPNDTLTVADLEQVLRSSGYLQETNQIQQQVAANSFVTDVENSLISLDSPGTAKKAPRGVKTVKTKAGGVVAFPQPSVLRQKDLRRGTMVSGGILGLLIGTTILPNLWLIGMILGGTYGHGLYPENVVVDIERYNNNPMRRLVLYTGRRISKLYLQLYDYCNTIWFLYKTGQLSYEYYQRYAELDNRFKIQDKMDAWNARFQEGKVKFDAWEKENEIGRTALAAMRTLWLVEEQSMKRASVAGMKRRSSKYRVVQYFYNVLYWSRRKLSLGRDTIRNLFVGGGGKESAFREFVNGVVRGDSLSAQQGGQNGWPQRRSRIGPIVASLVAVNILNSLFTIISPAFWTMTAVIIGIIWPSWAAELLSRVRRLTDETRARGRGEEVFSSSKALAPRATINNARTWLGLYDHTKYHYFVRPDGSKRYYRTVGGHSKPAYTSPKFEWQWPWSIEKSRPKPTRKGKREPRGEGKPQWGIFHN